MACQEKKFHLRKLLNYLLCSRDEGISVEINARDRTRIGDSASIWQRRDRPKGAGVGRMTFSTGCWRAVTVKPFGVSIPAVVFLRTQSLVTNENSFTTSVDRTVWWCAVIVLTPFVSTSYRLVNQDGPPWPVKAKTGAASYSVISRTASPWLLPSWTTSSQRVPTPTSPSN